MNLLIYGAVTAMTVSGATFAIHSVHELFAVQKGFMAYASTPDEVLSRSADAKLCQLQARALAVVDGGVAQARELASERGAEVKTATVGFGAAVAGARTGMVPPECRRFATAR